MKNRTFPVLDAARFTELEPGVEFGKNSCTRSGSVHQPGVRKSTRVCVSSLSFSKKHLIATIFIAVVAIVAAKAITTTDKK